MSAFPKVTDLSYEFKIQRRTAPAEVRNLWDLYIKTPKDDAYTKIVDADSLSTILGKVGLVFEADGL